MPDLEYEARWGKGPHFAADPVVICDNHVLLIQRADGLWALPGGMMEPGEAYIQTAIRECEEETGFVLQPVWHVHPEVYGSKNRDPRSHIVTVAATFIAPREAVLEQPLKHPADNTDPDEKLLAVEWKHTSEIKNLHFYADHEKIIRDSLHRVRGLI